MMWRYSNLIYEVMNEKHIPQLAKMYVDAFNAPPWNDRWTVETVTKRLLQMVHCDGFYGLLSYENDKVCGMILGNHEVFYDCIHFNIKEFCVCSKIRGTGIGSTLLKEFEKRLLERGIDEIYLITSRTEQTEIFYQRKGYRSCNDMVRMDKKIR